MTLLREENRFCDEDEDCEGNEIMSGYKTRRSQGGGTVTQVPAVSDAPRREAIQLVRRLSCDHTFFTTQERTKVSYIGWITLSVRYWYL